MGNSIHKKKKKEKVQVEGTVSCPPSFSSSPKRDTWSSFWLLGRPDKLKTGMVVYLRKSIHSLLSAFKKKAGPKGSEDQKRLTVHYTTSQHYQDNVFIEGSRPQYLEDLHTEAQEGLKILQQEEHKNGVNFDDHRSTSSTGTLHPEQDISSKDRVSSPESISTTGNTDITVTPATSASPVLTHQGSTFKPLNPVKKTDRSRKRNRRTTIMGIPNQVQKELALNRSSTFQPLVSTKLPDHNKHEGDGQTSVVIPTVDGGTPVANKEGARVHLSELEQVFRDEALVSKHLQDVYQKEQSHLCPTSALRPKSLAVTGIKTPFTLSPSMLSFFQEPPGPVMSISPQATYLSTIIPNAVLPASVEVIEIDRSISRTRGGSVNHGRSIRTVSKSSLTSGDSAVSPLLSRKSDGDGSQTNSSNYDITLMPKSASGSNWSESQSSKTVISDSLHTFSNKVGLDERESQTDLSGDLDLANLCNSAGVISSSSSKGENTTELGAESDTKELMTSGEQAKNKHNCAHSLSVMKTKQPPAPPRRINSLHGNKMRSDSKTVSDIKDLCNSASEKEETSKDTVAEGDTKLVTNNSTKLISFSNSTGSSPIDSSSGTLSSLQTSSYRNEEATKSSLESSTSPLQKYPPEGEKIERTMSPSSGYSSQSGTPTLSPKGIPTTSPDKQTKNPIKPERLASQASSSAASPSSSLTSLSSGTSELANADVSICTTTLSPQESSPIAATEELTPNSLPSNFKVEVRELLAIPSPPKVKAPCPPPPEAWAHNKCTVELLCGPSISKKVVYKQAQIQDSTENQEEAQTEPIKESQFADGNQKTTDKPLLEMSINTTTPMRMSVTHRQGDDGGDMKQVDRESLGTEQVQETKKANVQSREENGISGERVQEIQEATPKKDPPPVMKKPMRVLFSLDKERPVETKQNEERSAATEVQERNSTCSQDAVMIIDNSQTEKCENPYRQTLSVEVPKVSKISPPPTPPPAYQPTPPLKKKTPSSPISIPLNESPREQEESHVEDSCWPPPPPPLEGDSAFDGSEEVDFPLPPPPSVADSTMDVSDPTPAFSHPPENDSKPVVVAEVSKADIVDETSCQTVQNISSVSPPPAELSLVLPVTREKNILPVVAAVPSSSFLKRNSLKIEDPSLPALPVSAQLSAPITEQISPPPPTENVTHGLNFRRQSSGSYRDTRSKELLSRHKSSPIPKEDANIPLVTPSLLHMVRLRSVSMTEDQVKATLEDKSCNEGAPVMDNHPVSVQGSQNIPQKPIRKSLSLKSSVQTVKPSTVTIGSPSTCLQEAIRMKTAAMSSRDGLPSRMGIKSTNYSCVSQPHSQTLKSSEGCDMYKSPASTASFIFSRSTKKVVIETVAASSSETQASLKQSLAAELRQVSDQSKAGVFSNGRMKCDKVPPPVAKKPVPSSPSPSRIPPPCHSAKLELSFEGNGALGVQQMSDVAHPETTTRVTADTIETLF
ncbi:uncharacterized protein KIAA1522 homolog [Nematolebias whitei]|uniref:uncharacterized protein KIAA1522 homolog n=1 Tax=Nematolebias whitei TaxID=451745 RepID=UPI00189B0CBA|nr:uncharacterized protein KIAA1522 homolog [Nematolebias whitei]